MSFVLVGFGKMTRKDFGPVGRIQGCVWCGEAVIYHLVRSLTWLTFFFIPIFPYHCRHRVECPACGFFVAISDKEVTAAKRGELVIRRDVV